MPLRVTDLAPGDRVVLNCPKSRIMAKRQAVFEGIHNSIDAAMGKEDYAIVMGTGTAAFLDNAGQWAAFLFQTSHDRVVRLRHPDGSHDNIPNPGGSIDLRGAFAVEEDGSMRDEEGRRIYVERRLGRMAAG